MTEIQNKYMAKLKIRKLVRDQQIMYAKIQELTALVAYLTHRAGGSIVLTNEELQNIPDGMFGIKREETGIVLDIEYKTPEESVQKAEASEQTA